MSTSKLPKLPATDEGQSSLRYEVNPAIALNVLTDIYQQVQQHQRRLRQLVHKIQKIYAEGPVVSGWLASEADLDAAVKYSHHSSCSRSSETMDVALFRHGDTDDLMNYLSALESTMLENGASSHTATPGSQTHEAAPARSPNHVAPAKPTDNGRHSSQAYYLCQLDGSGQIQAELCPSDQVPVVSMAIARYRRLNQLIKRKQTIETKLQAIVAILGDAQRVLAE